MPGEIIICKDLAEISQKAADLFVQISKQAIQNSTQFWRAYNELGNIYQARADVRRALAYWEKSLLINPDQKELKESVNKLQKEIIS